MREAMNFSYSVLQNAGRQCPRAISPEEQEDQQQDRDRNANEPKQNVTHRNDPSFGCVVA
jgi:hypothetical protein